MFCYQIGTRGFLQRFPCCSLLLITFECRPYDQPLRGAGLKGAGRADKKRSALVILIIGFGISVQLIGLNQEENGALPEVLLPEATWWPPWDFREGLWYVIVTYLCPPLFILFCIENSLFYLAKYASSMLLSCGIYARWWEREREKLWWNLRTISRVRNFKFSQF